MCILRLGKAKPTMFYHNVSCPTASFNQRSKCKGKTHYVATKGILSLQMKPTGFFLCIPDFMALNIVDFDIFRNIVVFALGFTSFLKT